MKATTVMDQLLSPIADPVYNVQQLSAMDFGHPTTIRARIKADGVPFEVLDGRGTFGVRASNLHLLRKPVRRLPAPMAMDARASAAQVLAANITDVDLDGLAAITARIVAAWPRLSDERKREMGRLLATCRPSAGLVVLGLPDEGGGRRVVADGLVVPSCTQLAAGCTHPWVRRYGWSDAERWTSTQCSQLFRVLYRENSLTGFVPQIPNT